MVAMGVIAQFVRQKGLNQQKIAMEEKA